MNIQEDYQEFAEWILQELEDFYHEEARVEIHRITKNNREPELGICIMPRGETISPVVYLGEHYQNHRRGRGLVDVLHDIIREYKEAERLRFPVEQMKDWRKVMHRVGARLVCGVNNEDYLRNIPHRSFLDLAMVYYIFFEGPDERLSSATITNPQLEVWGITEEDLYRHSCRNLPRFMKPVVMRLESMLEDMLKDPEVREKAQMEEDRKICKSRKSDLQEEDPEEAENPEEMENLEDLEGDELWNLYPGTSLQVVTNHRRYMGAITLFYPGLLDDVLQKLGWDSCYIIPSSIHETLLFPGDLAGDENRLVDMVREVNETSVEPGERLSYSVYHYDIQNRILEMIHGHYPVKEQVILGLRTGSFRED